MITTYHDAIESVVQQVFGETWDTDPDRVLVWSHELVDVMVRCLDPEDCANEPEMIESEEEGDIPCHTSLGTRVVLTFMTDDLQRKQAVTFVVPVIQIFNGEMADLLEQIRVEFEFEDRTASLGDIEARMADIVASHQESAP